MNMLWGYEHFCRTSCFYEILNNSLYILVAKEIWKNPVKEQLECWTDGKSTISAWKNLGKWLLQKPVWVLIF